MSTALLTNLLEYLRGTLTPNNMQWLGEHLIEYAHEESQLQTYTVEDLLQMAETGRQQIAEGKCYTTDEVLQFCDDAQSQRKAV